MSLADLRRRLAALEAVVHVPQAQGPGSPSQVVVYPAGAPPQLLPRADGLPWFLIPDNGREDGAR